MGVKLCLSILCRSSNLNTSSAKVPAENSFLASNFHRKLAPSLVIGLRLDSHQANARRKACSAKTRCHRQCRNRRCRRRAKIYATIGFSKKYKGSGSLYIDKYQQNVKTLLNNTKLENNRGRITMQRDKNSPNTENPAADDFLDLDGLTLRTTVQ